MRSDAGCRGRGRRSPGRGKVTAPKIAEAVASESTAATSVPREAPLRRVFKRSLYGLGDVRKPHGSTVFSEEDATHSRVPVREPQLSVDHG